MSVEVEEFPEILLEEEEYINVRPALRVLMRLDDRVRMAVELLEKGETRDAVYLLREAGLEQDQIIYIISSVLRIPVEEAENIYIKETKSVKMTRQARGLGLDLLVNLINIMSLYQQEVIRPSPGTRIPTRSILRHLACTGNTNLLPISWKGTAAG